MNTVEKSYNIYWTDDYEKFKIYDKNRDIMKTYYTGKLIPSLKKHGWLETNPMIVDKNFYIKDGQHRFMAAAKLGIKIPYIIVNNYNDDVLLSINNNVKVWNAQDKIEYLAKMGDIYCKNALTLIKKYNITVMSMAKFTNHWRKWHTNYKFEEFDYNIVENKIIMAMDICDTVNFREERMILALSFIIDNKKYNHERMCSQLKSQTDKWHKCNSRTAYVELFEEIYNYRKHKNSRIKFLENN